MSHKAVVCLKCQATQDDRCDVCGAKSACTCTCPEPTAAELQAMIEDDKDTETCEHGVGFDEECQACDEEEDEGEEGDDAEESDNEL